MKRLLYKGKHAYNYIEVESNDNRTGVLKSANYQFSECLSIIRSNYKPNNYITSKNSVSTVCPALGITLLPTFAKL